MSLIVGEGAEDEVKIKVAEDEEEKDCNFLRGFSLQSHNLSNACDLIEWNVEILRTRGPRLSV